MDTLLEVLRWAVAITSLCTSVTLARLYVTSLTLWWSGKAIATSRARHARLAEASAAELELGRRGRDCLQLAGVLFPLAFMISGAGWATQYVAGAVAPRQIQAFSIMTSITAILACQLMLVPYWGRRQPYFIFGVAAGAALLTVMT